MGLFALHVGGQIETTTPKELHQALLDQDRRLMADLSGVKWGELFIGSNAQGMSAQTYTTGEQASQSPGNGYLWAVMSIGLELSVSSQVRLYKGQPSFAGPGTVAPSGNGRLVTTMASFVTPSAQFSKGQFTLRTAEQFTVVMVTAGSILSVYLAYIEVPAEQQGKLWL
jgi:hypothetical protein